MKVHWQTGHLQASVTAIFQIYHHLSLAAGVIFRHKRSRQLPKVSKLLCPPTLLLDMQLSRLHVPQLFILGFPQLFPWQEQLVPGLSFLGIQTDSVHIDDKP